MIQQAMNRFRPVKPGQPQNPASNPVQGYAQRFRPQGQPAQPGQPQVQPSAPLAPAIGGAAGGMTATPGLVHPVFHQPAPPPVPGQDPNLRGDVYTPGNDPRLSGAQGATDSASGAVQGAPSYSDEAAGLYARFRPLLSGGQTRFDAAKGVLQNLDETQGLQRQQGIRSIGQAAAALGRTGAGMTTNDLTGLETSLNREREQNLRQLSADTTEGDIGDRFRTLDMGMQGAGANSNDRFRRLGAAQDYESGVYGQGANNRDEFRRERQYQTDQGQQSIENRIRQRELQNTETNDRLRRGVLQSQYGNAGTPSLEDILRAQYAGAR